MYSASQAAETEAILLNYFHLRNPGDHFPYGIDQAIESKCIKKLLRHGYLDYGYNAMQLEFLTGKELKQLAGKYGQKTSGTKGQLIAQLKEVMSQRDFVNWRKQFKCYAMTPKGIDRAAEYKKQKETEKHRLEDTVLAEIIAGNLRRAYWLAVDYECKQSLPRECWNPMGCNWEQERKTMSRYKEWWETSLAVAITPEVKTVKALGVLRLMLGGGQSAKRLLELSQGQTHYSASQLESLTTLAGFERAAVDQSVNSMLQYTRLRGISGRKLPSAVEQEIRGNHVYRYYIATYYKASGDNHMWTQILQELVDDSSEAPAVYNTLAGIYKKNGDLERAKQVLQKGAATCRSSSGKNGHQQMLDRIKGL